MTTSRHNLPLVSALAAIVVSGVALRLVYLWYVSRTAGFVFLDPDGYSRLARTFLEGSGPWEWKLEAVHYQGDYYKAPLYVVFLSGVALLFDGSYRWAAAIIQAIVGAGAALAVFQMGRALHTRAAGIVAAAAYAVYFRNAVMVVGFSQEHLYVPLLSLAFATLLTACTRSEDRPSWMALSGVALGLATLTRSMPVYYVPVAAACWLWMRQDRRAAFQEAVALVGAFSLVVVPYSLFVSVQVGFPMLVENIGAYGLVRHRPSLELPGLLATTRFLWEQFAAAPVDFVTRKANLIIGMFQAPMGRWMQWHGSMPTLASATVLKWVAHLLGDLPVTIAMILAIPGLVVARCRRAAVLLGLWCVVHLGMTVMAEYSGHRFREPLEPMLFVLGSCVLVGSWRRPRLATLILAVTASLGLAAHTVIPSLARSLEARMDYGVGTWQRVESGRMTQARGSAGFNVFVRGEPLVIDLWRPEIHGLPRRLSVDVLIDGELVRSRLVGARARRIVHDSRGMMFVELRSNLPNAESIHWMVRTNEHGTQ